MKIFLLFYYILLCNNPKGGHGAGVDIKSKPLMCTYMTPGPGGYDGDKKIPYLEPKNIPEECEVIKFDITIDLNCKIHCDENLLKQLTQFKPVILVVSRDGGYIEWGKTLTPEINEEDIIALINFADKYNILGYDFFQINPSIRFLSDVLDVNVARNLIPYLKKFKTIKPKLLVGVSVDIAGPVLKNPCVIDFVQLNDIVDFYTMNTYVMENVCDPSIYNGMSPLHQRNHGPDYIMSMEEGTNILKTTKCDLTKLYYVVEVYPYNLNSDRYFFSYTDVCSESDFSSWCIQNTNDLYQKGKYVREQKSGVNIRYINFDNVLDVCGCGCFVGLTNIFAGSKGGKQKPCAKFDVIKSMEKY